jgi:hypothetical protein
MRENRTFLSSIKSNITEQSILPNPKIAFVGAHGVRPMDYKMDSA